MVNKLSFAFEVFDFKLVSLKNTLGQYESMKENMGEHIDKIGKKVMF